ncbi:MAG: VanZ family protein [Gemmataceae bacterium]|nr:VanZ family protein [Gemmata sp.]MDW8199580.1 VanZ family protein [Gemmataceae bacterium]
MGGLRWLLFLVVLGVWTWKLLEPIPVPAHITRELSDALRWLLAKALHLTAYAVLTLLALGLPQRPWGPRFLVGLLAVHAVATEIGQAFVPGRTCSIFDVLIDWLGIGGGLWLYRRRIRPPDHSKPQDPL